MSRPNRCPGGQHEIEWITDTLGLCSGHPCVWKYDGGKSGWGTLRGEWNPVAVDLAKELKELKVHVKPVVASAWDGDLDPETLRDKLVQWRSDQRMSQRQASVMLKVSRGIIADIEVGRRKMSKQIWERIRSATS